MESATDVLTATVPEAGGAAAEQAALPQLRRSTRVSKRASRDPAGHGAGDEDDGAAHAAPAPKKRRRRRDVDEREEDVQGTALGSLVAEDDDGDGDDVCPGGDPGAYITQTRALGSEFCLSKKDLALLPRSEMPNPHYRNAAPMKLFRCSDLWAAALKKHGSASGVFHAAAKRDAAATKRARTKAKKAKDRKAELAAALQRYGLTIRSDSFLCKNYLAHGATAEWSLDRVVRRMAEMRFLHDHTDYSSVLSRIRDEYRQNRERYDAQETAEQAESEVVCNLPEGDWPEQWPWMRAE
jgi:hypothetical protein